VAAYNASAYVRTAIEGVLAQTIGDIEVIVVDDGSIDNTAQVVQAIADERVRYVYQVNQGPSAARNAGIRLARGEFVAFLDSDDRWMPSKLEAQLDRFKEVPGAGLVHCTTIIVDNDGHVQRCQAASLEGYALDALLMGNKIATSSVMVPRHVFDRVGGFDESISRGEDWEMWLRISALFPIAAVSKPLVVYTLVPDSLAKNTPFLLKDCLSVVRKAFSSYGAHRNHLRRQVMARVHFGAGVGFGTSGHCSDARKELVRALCYYPLIPGAYWRLLLTFLGPALNRAARRTKDRVLGKLAGWGLQ
jgi:glycosyltransferase involved in cell wall biosynthesis